MIQGFGVVSGCDGVGVVRVGGKLVLHLHTAQEGVMRARSSIPVRSLVSQWQPDARFHEEVLPRHTDRQGGINGATGEEKLTNGGLQSLESGVIHFRWGYKGISRKHDTFQTKQTRHGEESAITFSEISRSSLLVGKYNHYPERVETGQWLPSKQRSNAVSNGNWARWGKLDGFFFFFTYDENLMEEQTEAVVKSLFNGKLQRT